MTGQDKNLRMATIRESSDDNANRVESLTVGAFEILKGATESLLIENIPAVIKYPHFHGGSEAAPGENRQDFIPAVPI